MSRLRHPVNHVMTSASTGYWVVGHIRGMRIRHFVSTYGGYPTARCGGSGPRPAVPTARPGRRSGPGYGPPRLRSATCRTTTLPSPEIPRPGPSCGPRLGDHIERARIRLPQLALGMGEGTPAARQELGHDAGRTHPTFSRLIFPSWNLKMCSMRNETCRSLPGIPASWPLGAAQRSPGHQLELGNRRTPRWSASAGQSLTMRRAGGSCSAASPALSALGNRLRPAPHQGLNLSPVAQETLPAVAALG